ncbi:MAG: S-layer homology domain-containing protein [Oscillospiraceae bacterium]|nr:S-layer homology domain-containing protein [Oscillospiraceae bacterium]
MKKITALLLALVLAVSVLSGAAAAGAISDVKEWAWYAPYVEQCVSLGWIDCRENGSFAPNEFMTRGEFVKALYGAYLLRSGQETASYTEMPFTDVEYHDENGNCTGVWDAVCWAYESGIAKGTGNGEFNPDGALSREMAATMLYRFLASDVKAEKEKSFTDERSTSFWAYEAIKWAAGVGLIKGYSDGSLKPRNYITRAEGAALVLRAAEL